jgi:hypothetical protein
MGARKNLTIGVTVNLEHYENLRLELSGEVESDEDAENLALFLDDLLGMFGRQDPATAERVNSYRRRVFPIAGKREISEGGQRNGICVPPATTENILSGHQEKAEKMYTDSIEPPVPAPWSASPPAAPAAVTLTCEVCGTIVSPAEQKMSQLFTSRTLCRGCLKKL